MNAHNPSKFQLPVRVVTRNNENPDDFREKDINFYSRSDRQWLAKHCYWAMHNNHSVTTYALT